MLIKKQKPLFPFLLLLQRSYDWCHQGRVDLERPPHSLTAAGTGSSDGCFGLDPP